MAQPEQLEALRKIRLMSEKISQLQLEYWQQYSHIETWGFKVSILMLLIPLVFLYFAIDRKNILLLGFYGLNIHVWFFYVNVIGVNLGWFSYPFEIIPFIPGNLSVDAALVPVLFILVYQWTINHDKNFYLYTIGLTLILSFAFKPLLVSIDMFVLHKGVNYFHLFILYFIVTIFSKIITNIFLKMQKKFRLSGGA